MKGSTADRMRTVTRTMLLVLLCVVFGALVWRFVHYAGVLLRYPYEWDEGEGMAIWEAKRLAEGRPIYGDPDQLPMFPAGYPPVYQAVVSLLVPRLGATLLAGRAVSVVALAILCLVIAAAVRQETKRWSLGLLAATLVVGSPYVSIWGPFSRLDTLATLLVITGVLVVRQFPRSRAALPVGLFLLLASCYAKYQVAFLALGAFAYLWQQNRRVAVISAVCFAAAGCAVFVGLMRWSDGYFWRNTVTVHTGLYSFRLLVAQAVDFALYHAFIVVGALVWLASCVTRPRLDVWAMCALASAPILLTTGHCGASINYYMPVVVVAAICTAQVVGQRVCDPSPRRSFVLPCLIMLALVAQGVVFRMHPLREPTEADRRAADSVLDLVRQHPGDILTERRVMFSLLTGREPQLDTCLLFYAYYIGRKLDFGPGAAGVRPGTRDPARRVYWDPRELIRAIGRGCYPLVVIEAAHLPPEVLEAIDGRYRMLQQERVAIGNWYGENRYFLMVPR